MELRPWVSKAGAPLSSPASWAGASMLLCCQERKVNQNRGDGLEEQGSMAETKVLE